jgi:hypothetical protein
LRFYACFAKDLGNALDALASCPYVRMSSLGRFEFTKHDLLDLAMALKDAWTGSLCADGRKPTEYVLVWDTSFNQAIGAIHAVEQRQDERAVLGRPSGRGSDLRE